MFLKYVLGMRKLACLNLWSFHEFSFSWEEESCIQSGMQHNWCMARLSWLHRIEPIHGNKSSAWMCEPGRCAVRVLPGRETLRWGKIVPFENDMSAVVAISIYPLPKFIHDMYRIDDCLPQLVAPIGRASPNHSCLFSQIHPPRHLGMRSYLLRIYIYIYIYLRTRSFFYKGQGK